MGIYRIILSIIVFVYHFTSLMITNHVSGASAVLGFYMLSGYLMVLVMDKVYSKYESGALLFYLNRFLRLIPLYLFFFFATLFLVFHHQTTIYQLNYGEMVQPYAILSPAISTYSIVDIIHDLFLEFFRHNQGPSSFALILNGYTDVVPTAWSLTSEIIYYLTVPLLVLFMRKNWSSKKNTIGNNIIISLFVVSILYTLFTSVIGLDFVWFRFKSLFGSYFVFLIGVLIYLYKDKLPSFSFPFTSFFTLLVVYLYVMYGVNYNKPLVESHVYFLLVLQILMLVVGSQLPKGNSFYKSFDNMCGKLCYGIFLGQFFSVTLFINILEKLSYKHNMILKIGLPGTTSFVICNLIFTIIIAVITYYTIEYPVEKIRTILRDKGLSGIRNNKDMSISTSKS